MEGMVGRGEGELGGVSTTNNKQKKQNNNNL